MRHTFLVETVKMVEIDVHLRKFSQN